MAKTIDPTKKSHTQAPRIFLTILKDISFVKIAQTSPSGTSLKQEICTMAAQWCTMAGTTPKNRFD
jgi:hypothetical protein